MFGLGDLMNGTWCVEVLGSSLGTGQSRTDLVQTPLPSGVVLNDRPSECKQHRVRNRSGIPLSDPKK